MHRGPCPGNGQSGVTGVNRSSGQILIIKTVEMLEMIYLFRCIYFLCLENRWAKLKTPTPKDIIIDTFCQLLPF